MTQSDPEKPETLVFRLSGVEHRASRTCFSKVVRKPTDEEVINRKKVFFGFRGGFSYVTGRQARGFSENLSLAGVNVGTQTGTDFKSKMGYEGTLGYTLNKTYGIYLSFNRELADQDYAFNLNSSWPLGEQVYRGLGTFQMDSYSLGLQAILGQNKLRPITRLAVGYSVVTASFNNFDLATEQKQRGTGLAITVGGGILFEIIPHILLDLQAGFTYLDIPEMTIISSDSGNEGYQYRTTPDFNRFSANLGIRVEL